MDASTYESLDIWYSSIIMICSRWKTPLPLSQELEKTKEHCKTGEGKLMEKHNYETFYNTTDSSFLIILQDNYLFRCSWIFLWLHSQSKSGTVRSDTNQFIRKTSFRLKSKIFIWSLLTSSYMVSILIFLDFLCYLNTVI